MGGWAQSTLPSSFTAGCEQRACQCWQMEQCVFWKPCTLTLLTHQAEVSNERGQEPTRSSHPDHRPTGEAPIPNVTLWGLVTFPPAGRKTWVLQRKNKTTENASSCRSTSILHPSWVHFKQDLGEENPENRSHLYYTPSFLFYTVFKEDLGSTSLPVLHNDPTTASQISHSGFTSWA